MHFNKKRSFFDRRKGEITFIACLCLAFFIKIYCIGLEAPQEGDGRVINFLNGALKPTPIPPEIQEKILLENQVLKTEVEILTLKSENERLAEVMRKEDQRRETIINILNKNLGGSLKNKGPIIYETSIKNKYPPFLQASIMIHETGNGTSKAVRDLNNVGGVFNGSKLKRYDSVDDSIRDQARIIKNYYIDQGLTTIKSFGNKYCPIGAENDPTGLNSSWIPTVTNLYIKLLNEAGGVV